MTLSIRKWSIALLALFSVLAGSIIAFAQSPTKEMKEGELDKFINTDATDTATKLEIIQQTLYEQEQQITALNFRLQYAGRIQMDQLLYPSDKELIPGYIFTPAKMEKGKKYPGLVLVHGGFHERLDWRFFDLIDTAVSRGYAVIFPEYRGSRGYGANHFHANSYGRTDVDDVLAAADFLAKKEYVDPARLAIVGHSRGGMVTLLAIQRAPKKFKAAVDIAGLADFLAYMAYKPDYRRQEVAKEAQFKGQLPVDNLPAYMEITPLNHVDKIETPLLVMGTTADKIVPLNLHSGRLVDALKARNKTHEYYEFNQAPGGHVFLFGESAERDELFQRTFDFVGKYLNVKVNAAPASKQEGGQ